MAQVSNLTNLYSELNKYGQNQDFERALKIANKSNYVLLFFLALTQCLHVFLGFHNFTLIAQICPYVQVYIILENHCES